MIVAHRLTKSFGRFKAVDSVDFEIPSGAVAGFLGPNGAGKTTTIRMLCGVLRPTAGRAVVDGLDVRTERQEAQRRIGYLPEAVPLYGEMRVREYLEFRGRLFELTRSARRTGVEAAMSKVGLTEVARRPIGQLSRGYRQRVGLAAALVHDPPVLILDEPTVGLDPAQVREVRRLIKDLAGDRTVLLSSHILAEVELICDRIVMLAAGRVRAAGSIEQIAASAGEARYVVETDTEGCAAALRSLAGVDEVDCARVDDRWFRLTVSPRNGTGDLREAIAGALREGGVAARELRRESPTLESLFVRLLSDAESVEADTREAEKP
jgi:ABC-2 type transport system ATP-binding protein